jgi:hypothetical protein
MGRASSPISKARAHARHGGPVAADEADARPESPVFVEARADHVGAEGERLRLVEHGGTDARAARIVDEELGSGGARDPDDVLEVVLREDLVGHGQAREDHEVHFGQARNGAPELVHAGAIREAAAPMRDRADHGRVAVAR